MVRPDLKGLPEIQIPDGYGVRTYVPGDEAHWARIINDSFGGNMSVADAVQSLMSQKQFVAEGLFFAAFQGTPVGTACAWCTPPDEVEVCDIHMVGVVRDHQGHGLGKLVSLYVLHFLAKRGVRGAQLNTDDDRLPAIKTYLNLGFKPSYRDASQPKRWQAVYDSLGIIR